MLFLATTTEEAALREAANRLKLPFEKIKDGRLGEYYRLGAVGHETVIAVRPVKERGRVVMGAIGHLGSAARAIRFREAFGAQAIVQLGMAFGIDPRSQRLGDVLVSTSLILYDTRTVVASDRPFRRLLCGEGYVSRYSDANRHPARMTLVALFDRERKRERYDFGIHVGAILSGAASIQSRCFRDELLRGVPIGDDPIVGGEMEGVGLLAASTSKNDPVWCIVKGISDFADERRADMIEEGRVIACKNAATFLLSALLNDVNPDELVRGAGDDQA